MAEQEIDSTHYICPYCGDKTDAADTNEPEISEIIECENCGKKFETYMQVSCSYYSVPDCQLNKEQHEEDEKCRSICKKCGRYINNFERKVK